jgi:hypothetical protein
MTAFYSEAEFTMGNENPSNPNPDELGENERTGDEPNPSRKSPKGKGGHKRPRQSSFSTRIGKSRTRMPVALNTALATAAFMPTMPIFADSFDSERIHPLVSFRDHQDLDRRRVRVDRDQIVREILVDVPGGLEVDLGRLEKCARETPYRPAHELAIGGLGIDDGPGRKG